ncbi:aspartate aminotransferase, mitochondrial-like [Hordeum vulgare subsp. vulgare]|uniref:aspartate aminotransferase, mitochondrial-like n=1 Tax=Hordeum vulgare subsp. vulgare TaxID=112509 RepID=UPI001D1A53A4|nr:aspartate aminotransferase, mitochondrial-like [Hordeum vulgare subsp. vulgare]
MALYRRAASAIQRRGAQPLLPARAMASLLGYVEPAPKDPILGVTEAFLADPPSTKSTSASAPTGTTTASPSCSTACARRSVGSPATST